MVFKKNALLLTLAVCASANADTTTTHQPLVLAKPETAATLQSPINIDRATNRNLPDIQFNYPLTMLFDVASNGHTIQATASNTDNAGKLQQASIELNGKEYNLVQIHMHAPSEHMVHNQRYPLEWHFVHQNPQDDSRVVIGVFMEDGDSTTPAYRPILDYLEHALRAERTPHSIGPCSAITFSPRALIPEDQRCWRYEGSLTSKPYSPVYWCVVRATTTINQHDLEVLFTAMNVNTRALQPVGNRTILFDTTLDRPLNKKRAKRSKRYGAARERVQLFQDDMRH